MSSVPSEAKEGQPNRLAPSGCECSSAGLRRRRSNDLGEVAGSAPHRPVPHITRRHHDHSGRRTRAVRFTSGRWYLVGWCRLRDAMRWFAVSRIERASVTKMACSGHTIHEIGEPPETPDLCTAGASDCLDQPLRSVQPAPGGGEHRAGCGRDRRRGELSTRGEAPAPGLRSRPCLVRPGHEGGRQTRLHREHRWPSSARSPHNRAQKSP